MEPTNAWDRAQQAIARAQQRNGTVVTPDNAESPYDASATQMIPAPFAPDGSPITHGRHGRPAPAPRHPADGRRPGQAPNGQPGGHRRPSPGEPETTPVEVSDPTLMRPVTEQPTVRTSATRPRTAPFPAQDGHPDGNGNGHGPERGPAPDDTPTTPPVGFQVPWWKRLFGRR